MDRAAVPLVPFYETLEERIIQFPVLDTERAWLCMLDIESWLQILSKGVGTLSHVGGSKGQVGLSYMRSVTALTSGQDFGMRLENQYSKYTVTVIDTYAKRIEFFADENGQVGKMYVQMIKANNQDVVQYSFQKRADYDKIPMLPIPFCCFGFYVKEKMRGMLRTAMIEAATRLKNHYEYYYPKGEDAM